ncbi:MAG: hypothetical protein IJB10_00675 [Clostridia bacterium]|nr:hypothetical protein [Clostridia bacterium]
MANYQKSGTKEILIFVSFICLIFAFLVGGEINNSDVFLKVLNIILLIVLKVIGFISALKSLIESVKAKSTIMTLLNCALILVYVTLLIKIIYMFE